MKTILSKFLFSIIGWKIVGSVKYPERCVIVAAPHTSNWDFLIGRCYAYIIGISPKYLIKKELFLPILGFFFRINGGIPVSRDTTYNFVEQISDLYKDNDFMLAIAPEGTRKRVERWKTGFYHIANRVNVPIVIVKIDYKLKEVGIVHQIIPSGNIDKDMLEIQRCFTNVTGKIPENYNPQIF